MHFFLFRCMIFERVKRRWFAWLSTKFIQNLKKHYAFYYRKLYKERWIWLLILKQRWIQILIYRCYCDVSNINVEHQRLKINVIVGLKKWMNKFLRSLLILLTDVMHIIFKVIVNDNPFNWKPGRSSTTGVQFPFAYYCCPQCANW